MNPKNCPTCRSPVPENAPGGLCPVCVLRDAEEPASTSRGAPSVEEIAAAFPQWEVLELIGQGGMGFVYKVRQPGLDRIVALKILAPELGRDPAFAERFAREARTLGKLQHPNIVTIFEHGDAGGFFYLLMEYVDGVNLRQAMCAGRFTPEQALAIVPPICDALQAAHAQGVWHRDIKPENILLDRDGGVKIADFGIARIVGESPQNFTLTLTGGVLGSAAYMAPEQHENPRGVDHRADIYSLGVVIYEMLTGELPLGRFPAPSQRAAVNARIDEIVLRTLEKERELRQQSADEVKTEVQGAASHRPLPAGTPTTSPANLMALVLSGCVALLVIATLLLSQMGRGNFPPAIAIAASLVAGLSLIFSVVCGVTVIYLTRPGRVAGTLSAAITLLVALLVFEGRGALQLAIGSAVLIAVGAAGSWYVTKSKAPKGNDASPGTSSPSRLPKWALWSLALLVLGVLAVPLVLWATYYFARSAPPREKLGFTSMEYSDEIQFAFFHPKAKGGGVSITVPLRSTKDWFPPDGQPLQMEDGAESIVRFRVVSIDPKSGPIFVTVQSSQDGGSHWESANGILDSQSSSRTLELGGEFQVKVTWFRVGEESSPSHVDWDIDQTSLARPKQVDEEKDWAPLQEYIKDGDMRAARGDLTGGLESYRAAADLIARTQRDHPEAAQEAQAQCLTRIGDVQCMQGELRDALVSYRNGTAILTRLLEKTPEDERLRNSLVQLHVKLGDIQQATGDPAAATRSYRDAVAVAGKLGENWETEYPIGSSGDKLARNYKAEEVFRLIEDKDRDSWDLMWMIGQAGADRDDRLLPLLERKDLREDATLALTLAGYDYSLNGNRSGLDYILAELSKQKVGADVNEVCVLSFIDEWDRSIKAVNSHFLATDGAGGDCMNSFWARRMLLFPRHYLEFKGKAGDGAPIGVKSKKSGNVLAPETPPVLQADAAPGNAMKGILEAAKNNNLRVFQAGFSKAFKDSLAKESETLDDFGDFGNIAFVSASMLDATNAEVVIEANDGSKRRFTFWMVLEDGDWKLNELNAKP